MSAIPNLIYKSLQSGQRFRPTGAGDAYRAGLLKGIVTGKDIKTVAKIGAVAAAYAIENYGTQEHHFTYEEFVGRYKSNFGGM